MPHIHIFRPAALTLIFASMDVIINGAVCHSLAYAESVELFVEAGQYEVAVGETTTMSATHTVNLEDDQTVYFEISIFNASNPRYFLSPIEPQYPTDGRHTCQRCGNFVDHYYTDPKELCGPCMVVARQPTGTQLFLGKSAFCCGYLFLLFALSMGGCLLYAWLS